MDLKNTVISEELKAKNADRLGLLMARVAPDNKEIKELKKFFDTNCQPAERVFGTIFDLLKSVGDRKTEDRKTIIEKLDKTKQLIALRAIHTKITTVTKILVTPKQS